MAPSNTDIKKPKKQSYLKRKREELGRRYEKKKLCKEIKIIWFR